MNEIFIRKEDNKKNLVISSRKIKDIVSYSEMQQREVRDFIYKTINQELKKIGINTQFGRFQSI